MRLDLGQGLSPERASPPSNPRDANDPLVDSDKQTFEHQVVSILGVNESDITSRNADKIPV